MGNMDMTTNAPAATEATSVVSSTANPDAAGPKVAELQTFDEGVRHGLGTAWADFCVKTGNDANSAEKRRDICLQRAIAALALSIVLFPHTNWSDRLAYHGIDDKKIRSKRKSAFAVTVTFGLNPDEKDQEVRKHNGQALDRYTLATEWMVDFIRDNLDDSLSNLTLDVQGIDTLTAELRSAGGLRVIADIQRDLYKANAASSKLRVSIDKTQAAKIVAKRGEQRLGEEDGLDENSSLPFFVDIKTGVKKTQRAVSDKLMNLIKAELFETAASNNPLVDVLGELMIVGAVVPNVVWEDHEEEGLEPGTVLCARQYALLPDKSLLVSPDASSEVVGPVIVARPVASILKAWPVMPSRLSTKGWKFAEANLVEPDRRPFFEASVTEVSDGTGAASIELSTAAVGTPKRSCVIDLEAIVAGDENAPVEFNAAAFGDVVEFSFNVAELKDMFGKLPAVLRQPNSFVKLTVYNMQGSLSIGNKLFEFSVTDSEFDGEVFLRSTNFIEVTKVAGTLGLGDDAAVAFSVDPKVGMRITFSTPIAAYELYVPVLRGGSHKPVTKGFRAISGV